MIKLFCVFFYLLNQTTFAETFFIEPKAYLDVISGKMIYGKLLKIKDQRIVSIEEPSHSRARKIVDLKDIYLIPGLIDSHSHVLFTQTLEDKNFEGALLREAKLSDSVRIKRAKLFMQQYLTAGFTSLCDLGNSGNFLDVKLKKYAQTHLEFPMLYVSGKGIAFNKAQFQNDDSISLVQKEYTLVDNNTEINKLLHIYLEKKIDILKLYLDNSPGPGFMSENFLTIFNFTPKKSFDY